MTGAVSNTKSMSVLQSRTGYNMRDADKHSPARLTTATEGNEGQRSDFTADATASYNPLIHTLSRYCGLHNALSRSRASALVCGLAIGSQGVVDDSQLTSNFKAVILRCRLVLSKSTATSRTKSSASTSDRSVAMMQAIPLRSQSNESKYGPVAVDGDFTQVVRSHI